MEGHSVWLGVPGLEPLVPGFGRFDLAALCGCRTLNFCLFLFGAYGLNSMLAMVGTLMIVEFTFMGESWIAEAQTSLALSLSRLCC